MQKKIWMPCKSTSLNPYLNGDWVEAKSEHCLEAAERWNLHRTKYLELSLNDLAGAEILESQDRRLSF